MSSFASLLGGGGGGGGGGEPASLAAGSQVFDAATLIHGGSRIVETVESGEWVVFTLKTICSETKKSTCNLYLHNVATLSNRQMTRMPLGTSVSNPILALGLPGAEDCVLFTKSSDGQVWSLPIRGGEAHKVTSPDFPLEIDSFKIFRGPDAQTYLACVLEVYPSSSPEQTAALDKENARAGTSTGQVYDSLMVRHWDTWNCYAKRKHVFVCPLGINEEGMFEAKASTLLDVMFGLETDCPVKPFGGAEEYAISPDGMNIALTCRKVNAADKKALKDMAWTTDVCVFLVPVPLFSTGASAATSDVFGTSSEPPAPLGSALFPSIGTHSSPSFSPDGNLLAYLKMRRPGYESDQQQIIIYDLKAKEVLSSLTQSVDLSFTSFKWGRTSSIESKEQEGSSAAEGTYTLFANAQYRGSTRIFRLKMSYPSGALASIEVLVGDESRSNIMLVDSEQRYALYFLEQSLLSPCELRLAMLGDASSSSAAAVEAESDLFEPFVFAPIDREGEYPLIKNESRKFRNVYCPCPQYTNGDVCMPIVKQYYFRTRSLTDEQTGDESARSGDFVHMWYLPPATLVQDEEHEDKVEHGSVPLVLLIHGGPQGAFLNGWSYRWNLAWYAARGYGVIAVNFHGSTSFGQGFTDSIRGDWGGQPFRDCLAGVDYILAQKKYLSPTRVGALGASYGGYMINWLNGHTNRFKCLVNHDGIFSLKNLYYTTEELWFPEYEFGLPFGASSGAADKWSPDAFIGEWQTPTLVIQGGKDYRVVETEGIATFTALQRRGIESRLLFFPDENHWCLKAANSLKWHSTVGEWLDKHLKEA